MTALFFLSLLLFVAGVVGVVRGRIDTRWFTTRTMSAVPLLLGVFFMFLTSAPPLSASGSVAGRFQVPPGASAVLADLEPWVRQGTPRAEDLQPEQQEAYPQWERQLIAAHNQADATMRRVEEVLAALDEGKIDRFTAWVHLGVLSQDLNQANLTIHDLTPPSLLDLADRKTLEEGLTNLKEGLDQKRRGIQQLREFLRTVDAAKIEHAQAEIEKGHDKMVAGLTKVARVKARLDVE